MLVVGFRARESGGYVKTVEWEMVLEMYWSSCSPSSELSRELLLSLSYKLYSNPSRDPASLQNKDCKVIGNSDENLSRKVARNSTGLSGLLTAHSVRAD